MLDRESKFVKNDQYNVSVVAMDTGECNFLEIEDIFLRKSWGEFCLFSYQNLMQNRFALMAQFSGDYPMSAPVHQ